MLLETINIHFFAISATMNMIPCPFAGCTEYAADVDDMVVHCAEQHGARTQRPCSYTFDVDNNADVLDISCDEAKKMLLHADGKNGPVLTIVFFGQTVCHGGLVVTVCTHKTGYAMIRVFMQMPPEIGRTFVCEDALGNRVDITPTLGTYPEPPFTFIAPFTRDAGDNMPESAAVSSVFPLRLYSKSVFSK